MSIRIYWPRDEMTRLEEDIMRAVHGRGFQILRNEADPEDPSAFFDLVVDAGTRAMAYTDNPNHVGLAAAHRLQFGVLRYDPRRGLFITHFFDGEADYVARQVWPRDPDFRIALAPAIH